MGLGLTLLDSVCLHLLLCNGCLQRDLVLHSLVLHCLVLHSLVQHPLLLLLCLQLLLVHSLLSRHPQPAT